VVTLEATTDKYGRVQEDVKVLNSVPELDQAAIDAVKQWVYEPMVIDGKPYGVTFTSTFRFSLKNERSGKSFEGGVTRADKKPPVPAVGNIKPPKLIKQVEPIYPREARKAGIAGVIIIEVTTDVYGRVIDTKILRGIPVLDQAARDAVKQWIYEPMIIDEKPRGVIFIVTLTFRLK
jgi:TonB family protein